MRERLRQIEQVGRGAMAEVFRGELCGEHGTSRPVAIKRLRRDLQGEPSAVDLFVNEATITVRLAHPNVVGGLELGRDDDGYFLVCEWLDCVTLEELHGRVGPLPWHVVAQLGEALSAGLAYVHGLRDGDGEPLKIVHRDITPSNVFVTRSGLPKVGDFGVACCSGNGQRDVADRVGTPGFAAPEQDDGKADPRSDIYGLGTTLRAVAGDLPAAIAAVIDKAATADPGERFESAEQMRRAFARATDDAQKETGESTPEDGLAELTRELDIGPGTTSGTNLDGALHSVFGGSIAGAIETTEVEIAPRPTAPTRLSHALVLTVVPIAIMAAITWAVLAYDSASSGSDGESGDASAASSATTNNGAPIASASGGTAGSAAEAGAETNTGAKDAGNVNKTGATAETGSKTETAPPVEKPPTPPAPPRTGRVNLNAQPWAEVIVDGKARGNTPLRDLLLSAGRHRFTLIHPPEGKPHHFTLEVTADKGQTFLIDLRRDAVSKRFNK